MIQAAQTKYIEPKASVKAKGAVAEEAKANDPESMIEGADFENELKASLGEEAEPKVKPVVVSPEMLMGAPAQLNATPGTESEVVSPKVFDPALTQGVDKIIQPQTTEVPVELTNEQILKLAQGEADPAINAEVEGEIAQAMLKTPQVQTGRAPALDLAKSEIDPQLVNMEDFVAQKNLAVKKSLNNTSAYGMPNKGHVGKAGMEVDLKSTQTINELGSTESGAGGSSMNSQQFILNAQADLGSNAKVNEMQAPMKTFNMSDVKTDNPNQIMTQITDYIVQAKAAKEPTVNMRVNHEELGMIDITVNKLAAGQDSIAINIATHSVDGKNFFQANSKDLFSHLTNSGLNVSDIKVETPSQTAKNEFDFGSQSGRGGSGQEKQFGSEQNQKRHDSDRRQDLWNLLKDKEAA